MSAGRKNNSTTKHWNTPPKILAVVREFFGGRIDLDPCSNEHSLVDASVQYELPEDGLSLEWFGNVFCNPPYGRNLENKTSLTRLDKQSSRKSRRNNNVDTSGHKYSPLLQDLGNGPKYLLLKRFAAEILDKWSRGQERCADGLLLGLLGV